MLDTNIHNNNNTSTHKNELIPKRNDEIKKKDL